MTFNPAFRALLVFQIESGTPLLTRIYDSSLNAHPNLIVAFLTAIMGFARETVHSELTFLTLESFNFYFIVKGDYNLVFAVLTSRLVSSTDVRFKLNTIASSFLDQYETDLPSSSAGGIDISLFADFCPIADEIIFGTTRGVDPRQKQIIEAQMFSVRSEMNLLGLGIYSFTGELILNLLGTNLEHLIQELFPRMELYRWVIMRITNSLLLFYPIKGEGLILILGDYSPDTLVEGAKRLHTKIREILIT
ncbi:MAG: hypothetical protein ACFFBD_29680 [Candidatus Hodarchaeota archaeon]